LSISPEGNLRTLSSLSLRIHFNICSRFLPSITAGVRIAWTSVLFKALLFLIFFFFLLLSLQPCSRQSVLTLGLPRHYSFQQIQVQTRLDFTCNTSSFVCLCVCTSPFVYRDAFFFARVDLLLSFSFDVYSSCMCMEQQTKHSVY